MAWRAAFVPCAVALALAVSPLLLGGVAATVPVASEEVLPASALPRDDECVAAGTAGEPACALVALQLLRPRRPAGDTLLVPKPQLTPEDLIVTDYDELKYAVENSPRGNTIEVVKGSVIPFAGTINIEENTAFNIWSHGATLDGKNQYGHVRLFYNRGNLSLSGFLIKSGKSDYAGAMYFDYRSWGKITNCNFLHNEATYMGGAIVAKGAGLVLSNVSFRDNRAENTCLSEKHCSRRRRNDRVGNAVYILSHTKVVSKTLQVQPTSQDFYFDRDFDGNARFCGAKPSLKANSPKIAKEYVHANGDPEDACNFDGDDDANRAA